MSHLVVTRCRLCDAELPPPALVLEDQPAANNLCETAEDALCAPRYPLGLVRCRACTSVQLTATVDPQVLFGNYTYVPVGSAFAAHWEELAESVGAGAGFAIEIGSNRGDLLGVLKARGWDVLGVEPAKGLAHLANDRGLPTLPDFFTEQVAGQIAADRGRARLIVATNVFAHIHDLPAVVRAVKRLLHPAGRFVFEVASLARDYEQGTFDRVLYAEHVFAHSVAPLHDLFLAHGMRIAQVDDIEFHGGSLRVAVEHGTGESADVRTRIAKELEPVGTATVAALDAFALRTHRTITRIRDGLGELRRQGKRVVGFTAPAKASVVLNACGLTPATIQYLADDNPLKVGRFVPGAAIPIMPMSALLEDHPDVVVLWSWNLAEGLIPRLPSGLRVIIPLPEWREVTT